jgi:23S rRNA pseudouridine955/2504/2580 synthase
MSVQTLEVTADDDGMRLDRFCHKKLGAPVSALQKAFRKGHIRLDGKKCEGNARIAAGQQVEVRTYFDAAPRPVKPTPLDERTIARAQAMVLHKDAHMIILNKPAGLAVQGGSKLKNHLDAMLPALQFEAEVPPKLVHRLDKDTSGLMVLARSAKAARVLQKAFAEKTIQKTYLALVHGIPTPHEGEIESRMEKRIGSHGNERMEISDTGKYAHTIYAVEDFMAKTAALVAMQPVTGRTHQLRVHAAEAGWPMVGDPKYGDMLRDAQLGMKEGLHLHAYKLIFPAILGQKPQQYSAPLPPHMRRSMQILGLHYEPNNARL